MNGQQREKSSWQVENETKGRKRKAFREKENERKDEKTESNREGTKAPQCAVSQLWWGEKRVKTCSHKGVLSFLVWRDMKYLCSQLLSVDVQLRIDR